MMAFSDLGNLVDSGENLGKVFFRVLGYGPSEITFFEIVRKFLVTVC